MDCVLLYVNTRRLWFDEQVKLQATLSDNESNPRLTIEGLILPVSGPSYAAIPPVGIGGYGARFYPCITWQVKRISKHYNFLVVIIPLPIFDFRILTKPVRLRETEIQVSKEIICLSRAGSF
jgi:hypothetical protein